MMHGHIDVVTSSGYIDGWATDTDHPTRPLALAILAGNGEVAHGVANRYRADLVDAQIGTGWCSFRFRASGPVGILRRSQLALVVLPDYKEIFRTDSPVIVESSDLQIRSVKELMGSDPTLVNSVEQLRGCGFIFSRLIQSSDIDVFVRAAYTYMLNRPADPMGLAHYSRLIMGGELTPFGLLEVLEDSDEFHSAPRMLIAPTQPGFIFSAL